METEEIPDLIPVDITSRQQPTAKSAIIESKTASPDPVPLSILTGWLGAGKTTLLHHIVEQLGKKSKTVAIIQNEASATSMEAPLRLRKQPEGTDVSEEDLFGEMLELGNGCLCCTVRNDFIRAIETLLKKRSFDYILVECSGLVDPGSLSSMFWVDEDLESRVYLDGIISVVDAFHLEANLHHEQSHSKQVIHQIAYADRILLNKADLVSAKAVDNLCKQLRLINASAPIVLTKYSQLHQPSSKTAPSVAAASSSAGTSVLPLILDIKAFDAQDAVKTLSNLKVEPTTEPSCSLCSDSSHTTGAHPLASDNHYHDSSITTFYVNTSDIKDTDRASERFVNLDKMNHWLGQLLWADDDGDSMTLSQQPETVAKDLSCTEFFRLKGVFSVKGSSTQFFLQGVQKLFEVQPSDVEWPKGPRQSKMIFIGRNLDKAALLRGFLACLE